MVDRTKYFITKWVNVSINRMEYLDREAWIESATIQSKSFVKPTNLGVPLQDTSGLPQHIHNSWLVSMVRRLGALARRTAMLRKRRRFSSTGFIKHLIEPRATPPRYESKPEKRCIEKYNKTKWRKNVGHVPITPNLGHTRCKSHLKSHA